jgi:uncharacterized protein (DUF58 family)
MLTQRGWWLFLTSGGMLAFGVWSQFSLMSLLGLVLLIWLIAEWLRFAICVRITVPWLRVERLVLDGRGPVGTLWAGRTFEVRVTLTKGSGPGLDYVVVDDALPFGVDDAGGSRSADGPFGAGGALSLTYKIRCISPGLARFEGVRVRLADLQGLFYHAAFVRAPVVLRVLPVLVSRRAGLAATKRINELPPPGVHRHRRPGSGSELLDLRDYIPGDPPKTIAWKISARRDRLITKEFESEVPIRCTLFVDTSTSVRVPSLSPPIGESDESWRPSRALDRVVEIAAGVVQANVVSRDVTVLCLFDENGSAVVKPDRTGSHLTQMLNRLAEAAALDPAVSRVDPDRLLPLAYAFAEQVYPELLTDDINGMPAFVTWFVDFPRRRRGKFRRLRRIYRARLLLWLAGAMGIPLLILLLYAAVVAYVIFSRQPQELIAMTISRGLAIAVVLSGLSATTAAIFLAATTLGGDRQRREQARRKRLAAMLSIRYGPIPGGLAALLEDEDQLSLLLQRFLSEHRVPFALPLYDSEGRYLFGAEGKVPVLATAILQAVGRGRDNELFVLLADVLEIDEGLAPLLRAVKVALGRHHQVLLVCPWPPSIQLPDEGRTTEAPAWVYPASPGARELPRGLAPLTTERFHTAYRRIRHTFGRLGVQVICAASDQPVALILDRIDRIRRVRRVH